MQLPPAANRAMDSAPVTSIVADVATLHRLSSEILGLCLQHGQYIRHGAQEMRRFVDSIALFQNALHRLAKPLEDDKRNWNDRMTHLHRSFAQESPIIKAAVQDIDGLLQRLQDAFARYPTLDRQESGLTWPLDAEETRTLEDRVYGVEDAIANAISLNVHHQVYKELGRRDRRSVGLSKELQRIQQQELRQDREIEKESARISSILAWLEPPDPFQSHDIVCTARNDGLHPGSWFLEGSEFERFQNASQSLLWLHGDAGIGKTVLCSVIIDHLRRRAQRSRSATVAFWYFSGVDKSRSSAESLLLALLHQILCSPSLKVPRAITDLWIAKARGAQRPRVSELAAMLRKVLSEIQRQDVYIVIDALDECNENDRAFVFGFLQQLLSGVRGSIHLLVTSRFEDELRVEFLALPYFQSVPIGDRAKGDVTMHVRETLRTDQVLSAWPSPELKRVEDALLKNTDGTFRQIDCQLHKFRGCKRPSDLDQLLHSLSTDLSQTYELELSRIQDADAKVALRLLQWMAFAQRPLSIDEVVEMLAVDVDAHPPNFVANDRMLNPIQVLSSCRSLIQIDRLNNRRRFSGSTIMNETLTCPHTSVLEFLKSHPLRIGSQDSEVLRLGSVNLQMATTCLVYLQHLSSSEPNLQEPSPEKYPFARYCARFWDEHYRIALRNGVGLDFSLLRGMAIDLLKNPQMLQVYFRLRALESRRDDDSLPAPEMRKMGALYFAASLGLADVVESLIGDDMELNQSQPYGYGTPLIASVANGHLDTVSLMLQAGADPSIPSEKYGYPLAVAIEHDEYDIVRLLLEQDGVDVDCQRMPPRIIAQRKESAARRQLDPSDSPARPRLPPQLDDNDAPDLKDRMNEAQARESMVYIAVEHYAKRTLNILLEHGADPNIEGGNCHTALILACAQGNEPVIDLLLENEAQTDVYGGMLGSVIGAVCLDGGHLELLKKLLASGVDVNIPLSTGETPLCIAAKKNELEVIGLLLQHGAEADTNPQRPVSPLEIVASNGDVAIAQRLLDAGAQVTSPGVEYSTILHAACTNADLGMVQLLLKYEADINHAPGKNDPTPLQYAASIGRNDVVDLLLSNGANAMALGGLFGNNMQAAVEGQNITILEKFKMSGLSVNVKGGPFTYPLLRALEISSYNTVEWLLDQGADVNVRNNDGSPYARYRPTAMHLCHDVRFAKVLLERGAQLDFTTDESVPPLVLAAGTGNEALVSFFLENGADPNARSPEDGTTPLLAAARGGHTDLVEPLVQYGADIHYRNACGLNAMTIAVQNRRLQFFRVLILHGAEGPTSVDTRGVSDLLYAAGSGKLEMMDYIMNSSEQEVTARDSNGWTALHWAAKSSWGSVKVIKRLLDLGIDPQSQDAQGRTALDIAISLRMENETQVLQAETQQQIEDVSDSDIENDENVETWWGFDTCNLCGSSRGDRYQCQECPDYNLCFRCILDKDSLHKKSHEFICVLEDGNGLKDTDPDNDRENFAISNALGVKVMPNHIALRIKTSSLRVSDAPLTSPSTPLELRWLDQRFRPDSNLSDGRVNSTNSFNPPPVPRKDSYLLLSPQVQDIISLGEPRELLRESTATSQSEYSDTSETGRALESKFSSVDEGYEQIAPKIAAYNPSGQRESLEDVDPNKDEPSYGPFHLRDETSPRTTIAHLSALSPGKVNTPAIPESVNSPGQEPLYSPRTIPPNSLRPPGAANRASENAPIPSHMSLHPPFAGDQDRNLEAVTPDSRVQDEPRASPDLLTSVKSNRDSDADPPAPLPKDSPPRSNAQLAGGLTPRMQHSTESTARDHPKELLTGHPGAAQAARPPTKIDETPLAHAWENRRYSRMSIPPPPPPKPGKPTVSPALPTAPAAVDGRFPLHMYSVPANVPAPLYSGIPGSPAGSPMAQSLLSKSSIPPLPLQSAQPGTASKLPQILQSSTARAKAPHPLQLQQHLPPFAPRLPQTVHQQSAPLSNLQSPSYPHHGHSSSVSRLPGAPTNPSQPRTLAQLAQQQDDQLPPPRQNSLDKIGQPIPPPLVLTQLRKHQQQTIPLRPSRHSIGGLEVNPDNAPSPLSGGPPPLTGGLPLSGAGFEPSPLSGTPASRLEMSPLTTRTGWQPSPFGELGSYFPPRPSQGSEPSFPPRPSDVSDLSYQQRPSDVSDMNYQQRPSEVSQISDLSFHPRPSQGSEGQFPPRPSQGSISHTLHRPSQESENQQLRRPLRSRDDSDSSSGSGLLGVVALPAEVSLGYGQDFSFDSTSGSKKDVKEAVEMPLMNEPQELEGDDRNTLKDVRKGGGNAWMADKQAENIKQNNRQERPADITTFHSEENKFQHGKTHLDLETPEGASPPLSSSPDAKARGFPSALEPSTPPKTGRNLNSSGGTAARLTAAAARAGTIAQAAVAAAAARNMSADSPRNASPSASGGETPRRPSSPLTNASRATGGRIPRNGNGPMVSPPTGRSESPFDAGFEIQKIGHMESFVGGTVATTITGGQPNRSMWPVREGTGMNSGSGSGWGRSEQGKKASPRMNQSPRLQQGSGEAFSRSSPRLQQQQHPSDQRTADRMRWERGRVDYERLYGGDSDEGC